jgi:hypothetical protein
VGHDNFAMEDNFNLQQIEDKLNVLANVRQPGSCEKWKTTLIFGKWETFLGLAQLSKILFNFNLSLLLP